MKNSIDCQKYNYAMDDVVQNFCYYRGHVKLTEEEDELEIWLKKPIERQMSNTKDE